jgi:hypothetical protein
VDGNVAIFCAVDSDRGVVLGLRMSIALIIIPTLCYLGVAVFAGYSVANLGFIMGLSK